MNLDDLRYTDGTTIVVDWQELLGGDCEGYTYAEPVGRPEVAEALDIPDATLELAGVPRTLVAIGPGFGIVDLSEYEEGIEEAAGDVDTSDLGCIEVERCSGPVMNYVYPLPDFHGSLGDAAGLPGCVCLMQFSPENQDRGLPEYGLALTGGGMDLSWEISRAYVRLGFLPPSGVVNRVPMFAGKTLTEEDDLVLHAMKREAEGKIRRATSTISELRRIREWYAEQAAT